MWFRCTSFLTHGFDVGKMSPCLLGCSLFVIIIIIIIKPTLAQVKQLIVTNALCHQSLKQNITVFKRFRNVVSDSALSAVRAGGSAFQAAGQA